MPVSSASTLHYPDIRKWHSDPDYSPLAAAILRNAYVMLFRNPNYLPAAYKAFAIASQGLKEPMCLQQRMNLLYVMAQSAREMGEAAMALQMLDSALTDSVVLHDRRSTAELLYISGNIKRAFMRPHAALSDLHASRSIIDDLKGSRSAVEPHLEFGVVYALSGVALFQARYADALPLLV